MDQDKVPTQASEPHRDYREGTPCSQVLWEDWEPASGSIQDSNREAQHGHVYPGCQATVQTATSREHFMS